MLPAAVKLTIVMMANKTYAQLPGKGRRLEGAGRMVAARGSRRVKQPLSSWMKKEKSSAEFTIRKMKMWPKVTKCR